MPKELQEKLLKLYLDGCLIKIDSNCTDGFAQLYRDAAGNILFRSEVFVDRALDDVDARLVTVAIAVQNWTALPI